MSNKTYNILIVEDEWINANFITQILETLNQNVLFVASSAKEALMFIEKQNIDFIFMDINIDGSCDGITLAHQINKLKVTPIIYLTAFGDSNTIEEASQTNIYGFIIKPFTERDVEAVLNVAIQQKEREIRQLTKKTKANSSVVTLGKNYSFDLEKSFLYHYNKNIVLSKNEAKLLHLLCLNQGHVLSLDTIRKAIWKDKDIGESNIRDTILRVRKKIVPLHLENIVGIGYILNKEA